MNEQIQLPAQEWLGYDPEKGDIHGYTFEQMREFAELIVQECIQVCQSRVGNSDYNTGRMHCVSDIKDHFGIEK